MMFLFSIVSNLARFVLCTLLNTVTFFTKTTKTARTSSDSFSSIIFFRRYWRFLSGFLLFLSQQCVCQRYFLGCEVINAVQNQYFIIPACQLFHISTVITGIDHRDLAVVIHQKRHERIGERILNDQNASFLSGFRIFHFNINLIIISPKVDGVLIFFIQEFLEINRFIWLAL